MSSPQHPLSALAKEFVRYLARELQPGICVEDVLQRKRGDTVRVRTATGWPGGLLEIDDVFTITETAANVTLDHLYYEIEIPLPIPLPIQTGSWLIVYDRYILPAAKDLVYCLRDRWPPGATLVTCAMHPAKLVASHVETDHNSGLSVRFAVDYDPVTDAWKTRIEMLFGFTGGLQAALAPLYMPTQEENETIALLIEARDQMQKQLERIRAA